MGIKGIALEDHRHIPFFRREIVYGDAIKIYLSFCRRLNSHNHVQESRFPTTARTDKGEKLAVLYGQIKLFDHRNISESLFYTFKSNFCHISSGDILCVHLNPLQPQRSILQ